MKRVFIDGSAGTTGLRIRERLADRKDLEVVTLAEEVRKDVSARRDALNAADVAFLCLPDAAAIEAVSLVENPDTVIIDTSTAHRTADGWEYGFPELAGRRARIASAKRIANPGCHASGFVSLVEPLVRAGLLSADVALCATSLTGYSGGGKKMIAEYEEKLKSSEVEKLKSSDEEKLKSSEVEKLKSLDEEKLKSSEVEKLKSSDEGAASANSSTLQLFNSSTLFLGGRQYALGQTHKHLPEMLKICGLSTAPAFLPIVVPHYSGMEVTVPVFAKDLKGAVDDVKAVFRASYGESTSVGGATVPVAQNGLVRFVEDPSEGGFLSSAKLSGKDTLEVSVYGNAERILLVSRFDNLGKGASGAAIQNMNIVLGAPETTGLAL